MAQTLTLRKSSGAIPRRVVRIQVERNHYLEASRQVYPVRHRLFTGGTSLILCTASTSRRIPWPPVYRHIFGNEDCAIYEASGRAEVQTSKTLLRLIKEDVQINGCSRNS